MQDNEKDQRPPNAWKQKMIIKVKFAYGTYTACCKGKRASCTSDARSAAERVAKKIMGDNPHWLGGRISGTNTEFFLYA